MTQETFREQLPLYAIGALDGDELREFEQYVAENPEDCGAELTEFQAVADHIALEAPAATPSPGVWEQLQRDIQSGGTAASQSRAPEVAGPRVSFASLLMR